MSTLPNRQFVAAVDSCHVAIMPRQAAGVEGQLQQETAMLRGELGMLNGSIAMFEDFHLVHGYGRAQESAYEAAAFGKRDEFGRFVDARNRTVFAIRAGGERGTKVTARIAPLNNLTQIGHVKMHPNARIVIDH